MIENRKGVESRGYWVRAWDGRGKFGVMWAWKVLGKFGGGCLGMGGESAWKVLG